MKRVAPDGKAYDLFEFVRWYDTLLEAPPWEGSLSNRRWREAPPLAEVPDEREIALEGMLTRSALAGDAADEEDADAVG